MRQLDSQQDPLPLWQLAVKLWQLGAKLW
jgi:hypothetical protein